MTGVITDIQRFSLHDGPGIRTTVFLKGCNMNCQWCHNPETINPKPEILLRPDKCIGCGGCDEGCFSGARTLCGTERTVEDVLAEVLQDAPYYGQEGGVTISGGEPMCQREFTAALLAACKGAGMHTAVESNLSFPFVQVQETLQDCALLLCDLKLWDDARHRAYTGIGNARIIENIRQISAAGMPIVLHTPVIPGVNDDQAELQAIAAFAADLPSLVCYELLPYHPLGLAKGMPEGYTPIRFERPTKAHMDGLAHALAGYGIPIRVGGIEVEG